MSSMSSQRKHDFLMAEPKREEAEKQEQAAMCLAKQKHKIVIRKKSLKYKQSRLHSKNLKKTTASVLTQLN